MLRKLGILCVATLMAGTACATAPRPRPKSEAAAARRQDTPEEKIAAMRGVDPNLHQYEEQRRWGVEEAKQRKRDAKAAASAPAKRADVVNSPGSPPPAPSPATPTP